VNDPAKQLAEYVVALTHEGYGTGLHWPYCRWVRCTGCLPPLELPDPPVDDQPDPFGLRSRP